MCAAVTIGINGFGRVGRQILHASLSNPNVTVAAINDPFLDNEYVKYLVDHDPAANGRKDIQVELRDGSICVDGQLMKLFHYSDASAIPWGENHVAVVVECSGVFTTTERASGHLAGGAQRVIITAPSADAQTIIVGANEDALKPGWQVISAGSCTAVALAPFLRLLHEHHGIEECTFTSVHACTSAQRAVDGSITKEWRLGRSALHNIIPSSSGAAKSIMKVIPALSGRIAGQSLRVPVQNGSVIDVALRFEKPVSKEGLDALLTESTSNGSALSRVIGVTTKEVVSSDIVGEPKSGIVDLKASYALNDHCHRLLVWYDIERGYAMRVVDLVGLGMQK